MREDWGKEIERILEGWPMAWNLGRSANGPAPVICGFSNGMDAYFLISCGRIALEVMR